MGSKNVKPSSKHSATPTPATGESSLNSQTAALKSNQDQVIAEDLDNEDVFESGANNYHHHHYNNNKLTSFHGGNNGHIKNANLASNPVFMNY